MKITVYGLTTEIESINSRIYGKLMYQTRIYHKEKLIFEDDTLAMSPFVSKFGIEVFCVFWDFIFNNCDSSYSHILKLGVSNLYQNIISIFLDNLNTEESQELFIDFVENIPLISQALIEEGVDLYELDLSKYSSPANFFDEFFSERDDFENLIKILFENC